MSGVPSPRVRKPKPRSRLNHFTCARSRPLVGATVTWVRGGGICAGWIGRRFIHAEDAKRLQALGPRQHFAHDARAFIRRLVAVAAQAGHVQQHVGHAVVGNDEAVTLGDIKPFDNARHFDDARSSSVISTSGPSPAPIDFVSIPSDAMTQRPPLLLCCAPRGRFTNLESFNSKITSAIQGESTKMQHTAKSVTACEHRWMTQQLDERFKHRSDVFAHDQIGDVIEFGRLAIDDDSRAPLRLAIKGNPAAGQTTSEEPIARKDRRTT